MVENEFTRLSNAEVGVSLLTTVARALIVDHKTILSFESLKALFIAVEHLEVLQVSIIGAQKFVSFEIF